MVWIENKLIKTDREIFIYISLWYINVELISVTMYNRNNCKLKMYIKFRFRGGEVGDVKSKEGKSFDFGYPLGMGHCSAGLNVARTEF